MRKVSVFLALVFGLTACGVGSTPLGAQSQVTPGLAAAGKIILTQTYSKSSGEYTGYTSTITQPTFKFTVAPGSLGVTVTGYSVQVLDSAGATLS